MSVQRVTVALLSTSQTGAVSRVKLVSQAVTGPAGADGAGVSVATKESGTEKVAVTTVLDFLSGFDVAGAAGVATVSLDLTEYAGGALPLANGGTGATTAADARTALGLGTAATTAATDYATAAQGTTADNAVPKSLVDAKGDIITATAADTPARLAVGTDGYVLTADARQATGIKWAAASGGGAIDPGWSARSGVTYKVIPGWIQFSRGTSTWGASTYYAPIVVPVAMTLSECLIDVTSTGTATLFRAAIYAAGTGANGHQPAALTHDFGTASVTSTGTKTISNSVTLAAGRYILAWTANGSVTTNHSVGTSAGQQTYLSLANNNTSSVIVATGDQTAGFASTGTAWTSWTGQSSWQQPLYFTRTA